MATPMLSGCVKWFNSRHKYGFITVTSEGDYKNVDLFVHQSNLNTKEPCYRFLIAGENVKFEVKITTDEKHPSQAVNVSEINGGSLKCELPKQHNSSYQPREHNSTHNGDGGYNRSEGTRVRSFSSAGGRGGFRGGNGVGGFSSGGGDNNNNNNNNNNSGRGAGGFRGRGGSRGGGDFGRSRFGVQERVSSTPSVNTDTV